MSAPEPQAEFVERMGSALTEAGLARLPSRVFAALLVDDDGRMTSAELAKRTGTHERYVREWLSAQAASGFVTYHKDHDTFSMTPEQAAVFADDESPVAMVGGFSLLSAVYHDEPRLAEAFKSGNGLHWSDHCNCMSCGVDRFFRPGYRANLIGAWLPALDGVLEKLQRGAKVADVACGVGWAAISLARAYPNITVDGFDLDEYSIEIARRNAAEAGVADQVTFETRDAADPALRGAYDVATVIEAIHDLSQPVAVLGAIHEMLKPGGTLIVADAGWSCQGRSVAVTAPRLPTPEPV